MDRRLFLTTAGAAGASLLVGCGNDRFKQIKYDPSPRRAMLAWIKEQHIKGTNEEDTLSRTIRWFRLNTLHFSGGRELTRKPGTILDALMNRTELGISILGCHGVASAFEHILGTLDIEVHVMRVELSTPNHATWYVPLVDRGLAHGDEVFRRRALVQDGQIHFEVPSEAMYIQGTDFEDLIRVRVQRDIDILLTYKPLVSVFGYAKSKKNGRAGSGQIPMTTFDGSVARCDVEGIDIEALTAAYRWLENEVAKRNGPEATLDLLGPMIIFPQKIGRTVPADFEGPL